MKRNNQRAKAHVQNIAESVRQPVLHSNSEFEKADSVGVSFLLEEFNLLADVVHNSVQHAERRVDVLLTLASAVLGGLALLLSQNDKIDLRASLAIACCSLLVLILVGYITFTQVVHLTISIAKHTRAINRIRYYFSEHSEQIKPFLMLPVSYKYPRYNLRTSWYRIVAIVNSVLVAAFVTAAFVETRLWVYQTPVVDLNTVKLATIEFFGLFVFSFFFHEWFARRTFGIAEAKTQDIRNIIDPRNQVMQ